MYASYFSSLCFMCVSCDVCVDVFALLFLSHTRWLSLVLGLLVNVFAGLVILRKRIQEDKDIEAELQESFLSLVT